MSKFRWSILTIFVVAIIGVACAFLARRIEAHRRQARIERYWNEYNAIVSFDARGHAKWLIANEGKPFFDPSGLPGLAQTPELELLVLVSTNVVDDDLRYLKAVPDLKMLALNNTKISDDALMHIRELRSLRHLFLSGTEISDEAAATLCQVTSLETIDITNTRISSEGVDLIRLSLPATTIIE